jgi:hypothetical protein
MEHIKMKCPHCGGKIKVDNSRNTMDMYCIDCGIHYTSDYLQGYWEGYEEGSENYPHIDCFYNGGCGCNNIRLGVEPKG